MFSKKTCQRCGRKTSKKDSFCPTCGTPLKKNQRRKDFGMLGEDDSFDEMKSLSNSLFGELEGMGGFGGNFMNKMISSTMKMFEKEMEKEMHRGSKIQNQNDSLPRTRIKLMINGKEVNINNDGVEGAANNEKKEKPKTIKFKKFSEEQIKKFSKLPRKEPKTDLKRIEDKIDYEIEIPGVNSFEDISILPLESSIEIKAISKEKAYSKTIPLNLPIINYMFSKGLLVLEFQGN
jgi:HSP20 family molecular chaperone IbpA